MAWYKFVRVDTVIGTMSHLAASITAIGTMGAGLEGQMFLELGERIGWAMLVVVVLAVPQFAQHGTAEAGLYTFDYHGDTWTGTLAAVDHEKGAITLEYEDKGKAESFTGIFKHPLEVVDQDGQPTKTRTHLQVGDRLTAYYIAQGSKYSMRGDDGKRHANVADDNLIFKIKLLPPPKQKR